MPLVVEEQPVAEEQVADSQAAARERALIKELFEEIQVEAYYLWQNRGSSHGDDLSDWFRAEEKLLAEARGL